MVREDDRNPRIWSGNHLDHIVNQIKEKRKIWQNKQHKSGNYGETERTNERIEKKGNNKKENSGGNRELRHNMGKQKHI